MIMALPSQVTYGRLMNRFRHFAEVGCHVMFEAFMANVFEQFLQLRNFRDAGAAEGLERIVGEPARPRVAANYSAAIVGRVAGIAHCSGFYFAYTGAERVLLAHGASDDLLVVHPDILEEVLG